MAQFQQYIHIYICIYIYIYKTLYILLESYVILCIWPLYIILHIIIYIYIYIHNLYNLYIHVVLVVLVVRRRPSSSFTRPRFKFNRNTKNATITTTEFLGQRRGRILKFQHQTSIRLGAGEKVTHNRNTVGRNWKLLLDLLHLKRLPLETVIIYEY